jgi:hypothetical protein
MGRMYASESAEGVRRRNAHEGLVERSWLIRFNRSFRLIRNFRQALSIHLARSFLIEKVKWWRLGDVGKTTNGRWVSL